MESKSEVVKELLTPEKPFTREQHKKMMGTYFTVRKDRVAACNHVYDGDSPSNNCPYCFAAFFYLNKDVCKLIEEIIEKEGVDTLIKIRGVKFKKWYFRFREDIRKKLAEELKHEENVN